MNKTPLKRSAIRRKSKKPRKSKPNVAAYFAYADDPQNRHCEIGEWLRVFWTDDGTARIWPAKTNPYFLPEKGAHHIFSYGSRQHERSNLIRISHIAHRLVHNGIKGEPQSIRLLCIAAKIKKRISLGDPAEFDLIKMRAIVGGNGIEGWLLSHKFSESWLEKIRHEGIASIESFGSES